MIPPIDNNGERDMGSNSCVSTPHAVLFPFMSKGHIIPLLHLSRLLLRFNITVTVITTPANRSFICNSVSDTTISVIDIPFPKNIPDDVISGIECTDKLPSMSLFPHFTNATKLMQPDFEKVLENLLPVSFIVSDGFLSWTLNSASKFGIPRLTTYGTNKYSNALCRVALRHQFLSNIKSDDEYVTAPSFPWIKLTRNDFDPVFRNPELTGPDMDFVVEVTVATSKSYGLLVNSFYELEPAFVDTWNCEFEPKAWCIGPLCLAETLKVKPEKPTWVQWLDQNLKQGKSVLYVAFGSQAEILPEQFKEIAIGLEKSQVNFLWVVKGEMSGFEDEFEERMKERGIVVREWVDQIEILAHESVKGFLSHCGWNSVLESICTCVPILAWPLMYDQYLNARMVVDEVKIVLRVETCNGSVRGFVKWEGLEKTVRELMVGEKGKEVRKKVIEAGEAARMAMEEGGSSSQTLDQLIDEILNKRM